MLHKTKAIVLGHLKYGESSLIVNMYTEEFGVQSYIENGVRKAKARNKIALFQPLTLLDLVVYKKNNSSLNRLSEMKCAQPFQQIPYKIVKSTVGIFLSEILSNLLRGEEEVNPSLFKFLEDSLIKFDKAETGYYNFHLQLLLKLTQFMGFYPSNAEELLEEVRPFHNIRLTTEQLAKLNILISAPNYFEEQANISGEERNIFLKLILQFYQIHSHSLKEVKSIKILHAVLHE
jgi:DNA repair protein RecO (recombination protein O)